MEREEINPFLVNLFGRGKCSDFGGIEYFAAVDFLLNTKLKLPKRKESHDSISEVDLDGMVLSDVLKLVPDPTKARFYLDDDGGNPYDQVEMLRLSFTVIESDEDYYHRVYKYLRRRGFPLEK